MLCYDIRELIKKYISGVPVDHFGFWLVKPQTGVSRSRVADVSVETVLSMARHSRR
jgi:hypothetical protein